MPLKIYKRGDTWHFRGTVAGRRLRGSTGAQEKDTAARIAAEIEAREWKGRLDGPSSVLTFAQAALKYREAGKPTRFLDKIEDYWKDALIKDITPGSIRQSATVLYPKATGATKNRAVIAPTQAIINHAAELELCSRVRVRRFQVVTKTKKPITWQWIETFVAQANDPCIAALAVFLFLTGARISEALAVEWRDIDFAAKKVLIRETKVGKERLAHLPPVLIAMLANLKRGPGKTVFQYADRGAARYAWKKALANGNIEALSFHSTRHGFATNLLHEGVDPVTVAKLGGWASAQHVFQTYGHSKDDPTLTERLVGTNLTQPRGVQKR
jgi:integrase